jgi:hypothetical protein
MGNTKKVFRVSDLPNMGAAVRGFSYGFTIYRGVLIQWDEDEDRRILTFIDQLPAKVRCGLSIVQEHEGGLGLVWCNGVPAGYEVGKEFEVEGDFWVVEKSKSAGKRQ